MIEKRSAKYIIVGAGLSGLTSAYQLLQNGEEDFLILEGKEYIGGRIHSQDNIDLGATWFQSYHSNLIQLLNTLGVEIFDQYSDGKSMLIYNEMAPPHHFESDSNSATSKRICGGSIALIDELTQSVQSKVILSTTLTNVIEVGNGLILQTNNGSFTANKVIITLPPKLASLLTYDPPLPGKLIDTMSQTHTWMSNAMKVGFTYNRSFWRDKNLSGTVINQTGPMLELYDHSDNSMGTSSLMGFVNKRLISMATEERKETILSYLEMYLGVEVRDYLNYQEKDWTDDKFTTDENKSLNGSTHYGNPYFQEFYMNDKLLFSGTETSPAHGGYMEGAVYSGMKAAEKLLGGVMITR